MNITKLSGVKDGVALISGALLTLAFAPFDIFPLAIISPAILLSLWIHTSAKQAFWRGWLYGLGLFSTGVYWIYISVHTFGPTSAPFAVLITGALIAFLALYPAMNGYLLNRFFPKTNNAKLFLAFPALWVLLEWARGWIFTGFPWLFVGYTQLHSPLQGYAPIFSVYGVSLVVLFSSALLVSTVIQFQKARYQALYIRLFSLAFLWGIGSVLSLISWTTPSGNPVTVSLVQGNIAQDIKWSPEQIQPTLEHYVALTKPYLGKSKIIIWPESAIPLPLQYATDFLEALSRIASQQHTTLITGIPIKADNTDAYYNGVIALGEGRGQYLKSRLVPFGEYVPLHNLLGRFLDFLQVPMSDFISGNTLPAPIMADNIKIATFICYEIAYPTQVLSRDGNIDMILTVSNDAWFGQSIAQAQHLEMAQMRALEMGRPILFVTNNGITAVINAKGRIQSQAPPYQSYVLTDQIQMTHGKTPWQYFAMYPIVILLMISLILALQLRNRV